MSALCCQGFTSKLAPKDRNRIAQSVHLEMGTVSVRLVPLGEGGGRFGASFGIVTGVLLPSGCRWKRQNSVTKARNAATDDTALLIGRTYNRRQTTGCSVIPIAPEQSGSTDGESMCVCVCLSFLLTFTLDTTMSPHTQQSAPIDMEMHPLTG